MRSFRGEYDNTPTANAGTLIPLFDIDGNIMSPLAADERLMVTDVSYRCTAATNLRVFFDSLGDASPTQPFAPTVSHTPAGTGIAAGTYSVYVTFYDPFTNTETVRSNGQSVTPVLGDSITVTANTPVPAYMTGIDGKQGFVRVYIVGIGLVGQTAPGANSVVLTSIAPLGPENTGNVGSSASGKIIGAALLGANGIWSDNFATPKYGPPGILPRVASSVATPIHITLSGQIVKRI